MAGEDQDSRLRYYDEPPVDNDDDSHIFIGDTAPLLEIGVDDTGAGVEDVQDDVGLPGSDIKPWLPPPPPPSHPGTPTRRPWCQVRSPRAVLATVSLIVFAVVLGVIVLVMPLARLVEDNVCRRHYGTPGPVPEEKCKVAEVQTRLAWLGGCASVVNSIMELLVSFPWGILADRFGRKPILQASFVGIIMSVCWSCFVISRPDLMPVELSIVGCLFIVFGGGGGTAITVIHAIIADVATDKASAFMWTSMGGVCGGVIGPALGAYMLQSCSSPWVPVGIAALIAIPAMLATTILPETKPASQPGAASNTNSKDGNKGFWPTLCAQSSDSAAALRSSVSMLRSAPVLCLIPSFFASQPVQAVQGGTLGQTLGGLWGWKVADLGYFFSARGLLTVLALALLPLLAKGGGGGVGRDLRLARASMLLMALGCLLTGFGLGGSGGGGGGGGGVPLFILGQLAVTLSAGSGSLSRSLLAGLAEGPDQTARLYALSGMAETLGSLVAGPAMPLAFGLGVRAGGLWLGVPFWLAGALCCLALAALLCVPRDGRAGARYSDDDDDDDEAVPEPAGEAAGRRSGTGESEETLIEI